MSSYILISHLIYIFSAVCSNGYLTYRHGELISEPKACNMCLCLYGEIVCQKPDCAPLQAGCHRINDEDVTNCCGEVICGKFLTLHAGLDL